MENNNTKHDSNKNTCFSENEIPEEKENYCCCSITEDQRDVMDENRSYCCSLSNFYLCLFCVEDCMCSCLERFTGVY